MEENQIVIDEESILYEETPQNTQNIVSDPETVALVGDENIDFYDGAFIGFGSAGVMCLLSLGIAVVLSMFRRA